MLLFAKRKEREVQAFMTKLVNNNCEELELLGEGPRLENRVRLSVVVLVIPVEHDKPVLEKTFPVVTKEFSTTGVALVLTESRGMNDVILAFRMERAMKFVRGKARHLNPMGAGFYQLGVKLTEIICPADYPGLGSVTL